MPVLLDPEHNETDALFRLYPDWMGKSVLEIGSGDGRLTWRFADRTSRVVAIEPDQEVHRIALADRPRSMGHVEFLNLGLDEFARGNKERFDIALLSWSL
jgi:16S rRNA A1518/A1519 N6-dimethyltransferase RsmA/KsgA/DIM1 with predicted DNA glycosylase/AP lyase activity